MSTDVVMGIRRPKLHLIVNTADLVSTASHESRFLMRLERCRAELLPVLDRLASRHAPEIVFAVMLAEIEDGAHVLCTHDRLDAIQIECVLERLRLAIEKVRGIPGD